MSCTIRFALKFFAAIGSLVAVYIVLTLVSNIGTWLLFGLGSGVYPIVVAGLTGLPWLVLGLIFARQAGQHPCYYFEEMLGRRTELYANVSLMSMTTGLILFAAMLVAGFFKVTGEWLGLAVVATFAACLLYNLVSRNVQTIKSALS